MNDVYPSRYLAADADVPEEGQLIVTFEKIEIEELGQGADAEDKPVAYFKETKKGLVLNKTNWAQIAKVLNADDSDDWIGRKIALFSTDVSFGKEMKRGIRVSGKLPKGAAPKLSEPAPVGAPDADDDTPF